MLVVLLVWLWQVPLQGALMQALAPLLHTRYASGLATTTLEALVADRDALYQENLDLKSRLGREVHVQRILAGVLLRPPATPYDTLIIDAGSQEGVAVDDRVAAAGTVLIGTVTQVYLHSAQVSLYSSPGQKYEGILTLQSGEALPITVVGQGGSSLSAQVPAGSKVVAGDQIVLPGVLGGLIGTVVGVQGGEGESFATVYLSLPINPADLRFVEVWKTRE